MNPGSVTRATARPHSAKPIEDSDLSSTVAVAEDVRRDLQSRTIPGEDGTLLKATVSAGCAQIDPADPTRQSLISRADVGPFMAKRAGRNQAVAA